MNWHNSDDGAIRAGEPPHPLESKREPALPKKKANHPRKMLSIKAAFAALAVFALVYSFNNSASRPNEVIHAEILAATPIGSRIEVVNKYAEENLGVTGSPGDNRTLEWSCPYGWCFELSTFPRTTTVSIQWQFIEGTGILRNVNVIRRSRWGLP